jgi:hypothetical protein
MAGVKPRFKIKGEKMELIKWDKISYEIESAKDIEELTNLKDRMKAYQVLAQQMKYSLEVQAKISVYKAKADRKCGEWLKENIKHGGNHASKSNDSTLLLTDLNISRDESSRLQKIADIPDQKFNDILKEAEENAKKITNNFLVNIAKEGKNFSLNNESGNRNESDFYQTPYSMTAQLLEKEFFDPNKSVLEPATGEGAIIKVLEKTWSSDNIKAIDINTGTDFLEYTGQADYIITNPPYSLAFEFVIKSKQVARDKFAMLLPLSYLHGQERYKEIYSLQDSYKLKRVLIFTRYPMLKKEIREDGKYTTGMQVYAWFIWVKGYNRNPEIDWINNNEFVLNQLNK